MSRICEEFHCTPLEALSQPLMLTGIIMDLRGYAWAKGEIDQAQSNDDLPHHPMIDAVWDTIEALRAERALSRGNEQD